MVGVVLVMLLVLPWMLQLMLNFTAQLFLHIPDYIR
jgi:flagellar biosynthesis protein FliQ